MGLCKTWEKDAPLASLALEGALCCLKSLKGRPSSGKDKSKEGGVGGEEALNEALKVLATAVGDFFRKRRGGGLTSLQVCVCAARCLRWWYCPKKWVPVDFLRELTEERWTEHLWTTASATTSTSSPGWWGRRFARSAMGGDV